MQRYDTYKDSGVKWLGEIPSHWEVLPGLAIFKENKEKNSNLAVNTVLSLSYGKIVVKKDIDEGLVPAEYNTYQIVHPGYIIIRCTDLQNDKVSLRTGLVKDDGIITGAYLGLVTNGKYNSSFMHYFLHVWDITKEIYRHGNGLRQSLSWLDLRRLPILIPPIAEQTAIANYLDTATAKIDAAIAQQQKMIDLLNERKQIIINRAVTKGLNPNAKMKDSGVEWIGEIPVGWKMMALRFLGSVEKKIINPQNHKSALFIEYSMPAYDNGRTPNVVSGENLESSKIILNGPTLLINKLNVHKKRIWFVQDPVVNSVASTEFVPLNILTANPLFIEYALQNQKVVDYLVNNSYGATNSQRRVSPETILRIKLPIPSDYEQMEIIQYLNKRIVEIDLAIDTLRNKISLLQERKQIIINEVVTGKVKVV